jgi:dihydroxyacetone kinase-like protein
MLGSAIEWHPGPRGGAQRGDKTLLDALIPVHEATAGRTPRAATRPRALKDSATVADAAVDETRSAGRASWPRRRRSASAARTRPDPGIVAIATILQIGAKNTA